VKCATSKPFFAGSLSNAPPITATERLETGFFGSLTLKQIHPLPYKFNALTTVKPCYDSIGHGTSSFQKIPKGPA